MIILVDVDNTVLDLTTVWLAPYNRDYGDCLTPAQIKGWWVHQYVKPECGHRIYDYLRLPDLYDPVEPFPGAVAGIDTLRKYGRVVFLTASHHPGKLSCLERHGLVRACNHGYPDYVIAFDKSLVRGDLLLDDNPRNLKHFGGVRLLYTQPHNLSYDAGQNFERQRIFRVDSWDGLSLCADQLEALIDFYNEGWTRA